MSPFFFLHIPRTAGTTLNAVFENHFAPGEILRVYNKEEYEAHKYHTPEFFEPIKLITGHLLLDSTDPPGIYGLPVRVLTLLREPVSRLVSEYEFLRTWESNHLYALLNEKKISFREYLGSAERLLFYRGKNFMTRCVSGEPFGDEPYPEKALAVAKKNLEVNFAFVGIQERFIESLLMLGDLLGMTNMLHDRRNALKPEAGTAPDEDDLDYARQLNRADMELYDFACALFDERVRALGEAFQTRVREFAFLNAKYRKISALLQQKADLADHGGISLPKDGLW